MTTIQRRELDLEALKLDKGNHRPDGQFCVMEAVAFIAGEGWTDSPQCASPVVAAFLRSWNDSLDDTTRQSLKQYIPRLVGSRGTAEHEKQRTWITTDWLVRVQAPAWLRLAGLTTNADALLTLKEINDSHSAKTAQPALDEARKKAAFAWVAAWDAAWDAARAAARDAAWDAAGDAARAAAWDAAWDAARDAARAAAWAAARDAARAAARDAAWDALQPIVIELQASAHQLVDRMLAVTGN